MDHNENIKYMYYYYTKFFVAVQSFSQLTSDSKRRKLFLVCTVFEKYVNQVFFSIQENHAAITAKGGMFSIERIGESKVLKNGQAVSINVELNHLDRFEFKTIINKIKNKKL